MLPDSCRIVFIKLLEQVFLDSCNLSCQLCDLSVLISLRCVKFLHLLVEHGIKLLYLLIVGLKHLLEILNCRPVHHFGVDVTIENI